MYSKLVTKLLCNTVFRLRMLEKHRYPMCALYPPSTLACKFIKWLCTSPIYQTMHQNMCAQTCTTKPLSNRICTHYAHWWPVGQVTTVESWGSSEIFTRNRLEARGTSDQTSGCLNFDGPNYSKNTPFLVGNLFASHVFMKEDKSHSLVVFFHALLWF